MTTPPDLRPVRLAYGTTGIVVRLPAAATTVLEPRVVAPAADPAAALRAALGRPVAGPRLRELVRRGQRVAVAICDGTRPQPRQPMLQALLDELEGVAGIGDIVVVVATGTHRANTPEELRSMLGPLAEAAEVVNHDSRDATTLVWCGRHGRDVPVWLNRHWVEADIRVTTGFVEPHFFAGFSGGPKLVAPGLAGLETVLTLHDYHRIASPDATWGRVEGNPVHDDIRAIAAATGVDFGFDVVLDRAQRIVGAFAGSLPEMHRVARQASAELAMTPVSGRFEVVVTTNAGWPLDQNLYQAVKGMSAGAQVVEPGGTIICAAECRDGFPDHGSYRPLLATAPSIHEVAAGFARSGHTIPDQWQVQVQARVQSAARVLVHTGHLSAGELAEAHLEPADDIEAAVGEALAAAGPGARVCVLPEGPQTIPYVTSVRAPQSPS